MRDKIIAPDVGMKKAGDTMRRVIGESPSEQTTTDARWIKDAARRAGFEGGFVRGGKETL